MLKGAVGDLQWLQQCGHGAVTWRMAGAVQRERPGSPGGPEGHGMILPRGKGTW